MPDDKIVPDISPSPQIIAYFHCGQCLTEKPPGQSPQEYADLSVGWTQLGLQVFCNRHEVNIIHVDFEGAQHVADMTTSGRFGSADAEPKANSGDGG